MSAMVKNIEDIFMRFDRILKRDRRTDTARQHKPCLCNSIARQKIRAICGGITLAATPQSYDSSLRTWPSSWFQLPTYQVSCLQLKRLRRYRANETLLTQQNTQTYKHLPIYSQPTTHTDRQTRWKQPAFAIARLVNSVILRHFIRWTRILLLNFF